MAFVFQLTLRSEPDILCVSEHWMDSVSINNLCLDGFSVVSSFSRLEGRFGGTAVFVGDHLSASPVDVSSFSVDFIFECSAVSLFKDELLLVCVYRTPSSDASSFFDRLRQFDDFFSGGSNFKRIIYVGDFNIDVLIDSHLSRSFKALLTTLGLTIFDAGAPTRITESSRTCIDFFLVRDNSLSLHLFTYSQVAVTFSDHIAISLDFPMVFPVRMVEEGGPKHFVLNERNLLRFSLHFHLLDWSSFYGSNDPEYLAHIFIENISNIYSKVSQRSVVDPTCARIKFKKQKLARLRKKCRKSPNFLNYYRSYRKHYSNFLNDFIRKKNSYIILHSKNKMKAVWGLINGYSSTVGKDEHLESLGSHELDLLNSHFINVPLEINRSFGGSGAWDAPSIKSDDSIYLWPTDFFETSNAIQSLNNSKSVDIFGFSNVFLKKISPLIVSQMIHLINSVFLTGIFPASLKYSILRPVFKGGTDHSYNNYRPISIVPSLSKVLEKIIFKRIYGFLSVKGFFSSAQFGFLPRRSTEMGLFRLFCDLSGDRESALISFDMRKAFDTVDHPLLLGKLRSVGVRGVALEVISSFISDRYQKVMNRNSSSSFLVNNLGVPQGSILGPLLFIIFINNIAMINTGILMYADDVYFVGRTIDIDSNINLIKAWADSNKLMLNTAKTKLLVPSHPNAEPIKVLGVHFQDLKSFDFHFKQTLGALNSAIFQLKKIQPLLPVFALLIAYDAIFMSKIRYCFTVWCETTFIHRLTLLQKRAIRSIFGERTNTSCIPYFRKYRLLTIATLFILNNVKFFCDRRYVVERDPGSRSLRASTISFQPRPGFLNRKTCMGAKVMDHFPRDIFLLPYPVMLRIVRNFLRENPFYTLNEFFDRTVNYDAGEGKLLFAGVPSYSV